MQKRLLATLVLAALTAVPATLPAQNVEDTSILEMVGLRHANVVEVHRIVSQLFGGRQTSPRVTIDPKTNTLWIHARGQKDVDQILKLVKALDVPAEPNQIGVSTAILKPKYRTTREIKPIIELYASRSGQLAINESTNSIVVRDEAPRIQQMQEVIDRLDVDPQVVYFDCWVLAPSESSTLQGELAPLAEEFRRQGLGSYGLFSHSSVRAIEGENFKVSQQFKRRQMRSIELRGNMRLGSQAILFLETMIAVGLPSESPEEEADTRLNLTTTLKAGIGELVVLGLAPTGNENSKPLALVVRIRR